ncbi:MAG: helix-turn-helix domain-containing protein [Desulfosudaceae bacterium]
MTAKPSLNIQEQYLLSASVFVLLLVLAAAMFYPLFKIGQPKRMIPLDGEWKISLDDLPEFSRPDYDDTAWDTIDLPGEIVAYSRHKDRGIRGVCWLRKKFSVEADRCDSGADGDGDFGLILGRIANADQTYVNGRQIGRTGQFPPHEFSMWNHPRNYLLPAEYLKNGTDNVIAVRVSYNVMGEVVGNLMITDLAYLNRYAPYSRFIHVTIGYATISIGFVLVLAFLFSRLKSLEFDENYFYFLQFFAGLPIILELCLSWEIYPDHLTRLKVLGLAWVALNVFHPAFLHRFYGLSRSRPEKALWAYLVICLIGAVFFTNENNIRFMGTLLIVVTWCIGFYNMSCHFEALYKKRQHSGIFSLFGLVAIAAAMNDGLIYFDKFVNFNVSLFGWTPTLMVLPAGGIFLFVGTFLVLEARYRLMADEIDDLNQDLESFIIKNSLLNQTIEKTLAEKKSRPNTATITPEAEEKILAAIDFIRENYLSEVSRDDLARSVGVHPDSLGKQFKRYTGRKLGDYIYELRIQEAARRLRETDDNIINIAFEVGFESLRTFNRVFPRYMKVTPRQYRQQHR